MIAVLGLAILGAVGAFAYRAVFEGAVLPALPALIEAENGPNKNVPNYGDAWPSNSSQTSIASAGSSEKFVSRWAADIQEPPKKTAPISPNPSAPPPSALGSGAVAPIAPVPAAPPPAVAPPATASVPPPAPVPAPPSSEPKKIHTVIIRSDGSGQTDTSAAAAPHSTTSTTAPEAKPSAAAAR